MGTPWLHGRGSREAILLGAPNLEHDRARKDRYDQTEQSGGRKKRLLSVPALVQKRLGHAARPCTGWQALVDVLWWRAPPNLPPIKINLAFIGECVSTITKRSRALRPSYGSDKKIHLNPARTSRTKQATRVRDTSTWPLAT